MALFASPIARLDRGTVIPLAAALIFVVALASIASALAFEHIGGYAPCPLCLKQRWAYYAGIPLAGFALLLALYERRDPAVLALTLCGAGFLVNSGLGVYHAGVEWGFWPGPADCAGGDFTAPVGDLLQSLRETRIVRCDEAPWQFLGLSFAGYSALISLGLAVVAFAAIWLGWRSGEKS